MALAVMLLWTTAGCNLIQVDTEKDMERVVIKMGDEEILKKEFNKYLTYNTLIYEVNGYALPEGDSLKTLKEDLLDTMVEIRLLRDQAEKSNLDVTLDDLQEEVDNMLTTFKTELGEDKYDRILTDNHMTREEFETFFRQYMEDVRYANAAIGDFTTQLRSNAKEELDKVIMKVNGEDILKSEFYYRLSMMEFDYYMGTGSGLPSDEESLEFIYEELRNDLAESRLMALKATEAGIQAETTEIEDKAKSLKANFTTYFNNETLGTYLADYYLTVPIFDELLLKDAQRAVLIEKYQKSLETGTTVTSDEIKEYYDKNKSNYDADTVSAKHILVEDEAYANELMTSITDSASFETVFARVQNDDKVKEAADLGAFKFGQMVKEFAGAAFAMAPGQVSSKPVKTEFGYHILYVYDKHTAVIPTLEEKTEEIRTGLVKSKALEKYTDEASATLEKADISKEDIKEPFEVYLDELLEEYGVITYPSRV
jgi:foldase protein PrsA